MSNIYHFDSTCEAVKRIYFSYFKRTPITHFDYEKYYDNGETLLLSTSPEIEIVVRENLLPVKCEFDMVDRINQQFLLLSHAIDLPDGVNVEKHAKTIEQHIRNVKEKHGLCTKRELLDFWYQQVAV